MSAASGAAAWGFSPKQRSSHFGDDANANVSLESATKYGREESGLRLILRNVYGTTTMSANAFDAIIEKNMFICCAGPTAVLFHMDEHLNISQRYFRAKPHVSPVNGTQSFYNHPMPPSTPTKSRLGSPLKVQSLGLGSTVSSDYALDAPGQSGVANRSREVSCVSLSQEGNLVAVGEVNKN